MLSPQVMLMAAKLALLPTMGVAVMTLMYSIGAARALPWTLLLWALILQAWLWISFMDPSNRVMWELGLYLPDEENKSVVAVASLGVCLAFWSVLAVAKAVAFLLVWAVRGSASQSSAKPQVANLQAIMRVRGTQSPRSARYVALLSAASHGDVREIGPISRTN
ncbi:MAG: hypothetical protein ACR2OV_04030 [Hyphomicrobiaceae bacterium]